MTNKDIGEGRKTKMILRQDQTIQTKQDVPKQGNKILPTGRRRIGKAIPTTKCERSEKIFDQTMGTEIS